MLQLICSSKILLNAGKSGEYYDPNEGTVHNYRQSAGKTIAMAWGFNRWGRFFFNRTKKGEWKTILLSRHLNSEYKPNNYRPVCGGNNSNLWFPYRNKNSIRNKKNKTLENTDYRVQEMFQVPTRHNSLFTGKKGRSGVGIKICSDTWTKSYPRTRTNETGTFSNSASSETIRKTVSNTEDIVRPDMRISELGRNDLTILCG